MYRISAKPQYNTQPQGFEFSIFVAAAAELVLFLLLFGEASRVRQDRYSKGMRRGNLLPRVHSPQTSAVAPGAGIPDIV